MPVVSNRLLTALSPELRASLLEKTVSVPLPVRTSLFEPGVVPKFAYFVTSGIASVVADMERGNAVEVGLLRCEALPGTIQLLGQQEGSTRCFMQVAGAG